MHRLDVSGLASPAPILKTRRKLRDLSEGERLEVFTTDPEMVSVLPAFCTAAGHSLIMAREARGGWLFEICCGGVLPDSAVLVAAE